MQMKLHQPLDYARHIWSDRPATVWEEAYPLGNATLGAMVFGDVQQERIALNEDSLWYGGPRDRNNPDALAHLEEIRTRLRDGQLKSAHQLAAMALSAVPENQRHYTPLGDLKLTFDSEGQEPEHYRRDLDVREGIVTVGYQVGDRAFRREHFVSHPDQVLVIRFTASTSRAIGFTARLMRGQKNRYFDENVKLEENTLMMRGHGGGEGAVHFRTGLRVIADSGTVRLIGEHLVVEHADQVTLLLAAATTFRHQDPEAWVMERLAQAAGQSHEALQQRHIKDVSVLMDRVELKLSAAQQSTANDLPTAERLERLKQGETDMGLVPLYVNYGRYLLVSSSRPGSLPANLQGIWNEHMQPPWDSKYTININTQMNYWPAEPGNLAECHEPLLEHIERMREPGRHTAKLMYNCGGFVAHHNTDIWADTAPQDIYLPATHWPMGAAWLSLHLWEHYEYGRDQAYLADVYPTLKEAAAFFEDFLTETDNGELVTNPSVSPENRYILPDGTSGTLCIGPSMDSQILHELFSACIKAATELEMDQQQQKVWLQLRERLPQPKVGKHGQIQEWVEDYEEAEPGHRHISQLFALHPGTRFTIRDTPAWAEAAKATLKRRLAYGGGHTGWSRAWIINFWARLEEGELALENIMALLAQSTLPNLLDNHPPFQIDGNFGGTAGVLEMLLQSHAGCIHLLPALPTAWADGEIRGLRARGAVEVDMCWKAGTLVHAVLRPHQDGEIRIRVAGAEGLRLQEQSEWRILPAEGPELHQQQLQERQPQGQQQKWIKIPHGQVEADTIVFKAKAGREYMLTS